MLTTHNLLDDISETSDGLESDGNADQLNSTVLKTTQNQKVTTNEKGPTTLKKHHPQSCSSKNKSVGRVHEDKTSPQSKQAESQQEH